MFIDELISRYEVKEDFFEVSLPDGETLKFRHVKDYAELKVLHEGAIAFATKMAKGEGVLPAWKEYTTDSRDTLIAVYVLAYTIQEPKLEQIDLLRLAKKAGVIFQYILNEYNRKETEHYVKRDVAEVEEAKND